MIRRTVRIICAKSPDKYGRALAYTYGGRVFYCSACGARVKVVW